MKGLFFLTHNFGFLLAITTHVPSLLPALLIKHVSYDGPKHNHFQNITCTGITISVRTFAKSLSPRWSTPAPHTRGPLSKHNRRGGGYFAGGCHMTFWVKATPLHIRTIFLHEKSIQLHPLCLTCFIGRGKFNYVMIG
jgi:hypothetical protein